MQGRNEYDNRKFKRKRNQMAMIGILQLNQGENIDDCFK